MAYRFHRALLGAGCFGAAVVGVGCNPGPQKITCDPGYVAVTVNDTYFCTQTPSTACADGGIAYATAANEYACAVPTENPCKKGEVLVRQDTGTYVCETPPSITCAANQVVVQAKDGSYSCVQQTNTTLGSLTCPTGTTPNLTNTACVTIPQIVCQNGFVPAQNSTTGEWNCVDTASQNKVQRTVSGVFTDCATGLPLSGVKVLLQGLGSYTTTTPATPQDAGVTDAGPTDAGATDAGHVADAGKAPVVDAGATTTLSTSTTVTTASDGTFSTTGIASTSSILWTATLDGYQVKTDVITVSATTGTDAYQDPAAITGTKSCLNANPIGNLTISGVVIAGTQPASKATLYLYNKSSASASGNVAPNLVQTVTTDANGVFSFKDLDNLAYSIQIAPYTSTGSNVQTYLPYTWDCNATGSTPPLLLDCAENVGNLRLTLKLANDGLGRIQATNLLQAANAQPVTACASSTTSGKVSGADTSAVCLPSQFTDLVNASVPTSAPWVVTNPQSPITFVSDLPWDTAANTVVELYYIQQTASAGGASGQTFTKLNVTPSVSTDGATLSLALGTGVTGDQSTSTFYELRFHQLAFADGEWAVPPGATKSIYFDVKSVTKYLDNPTPTLYPGEVSLATTVVTDSNQVRWLSSTGWDLGKDQNYTAATGSPGPIPIQFSDVGNVGQAYNVYARVGDANNSTSDVAWVKAGTCALDASKVVANKRTCDVSLAGLTFASPSVFNSSSPLGYKEQIQLAVTSVAVDGTESPIDTGKLLTLTDTSFLGLYSAATNTTKGSSVPASGKSASYEAVDLTFFETVNTATSPTGTIFDAVTGNGGVATTIVAPQWTWSTSTPVKAGTVGMMMSNNKYDTCAVVQGFVDGGKSAVVVDNVSAFTGISNSTPVWAFTVNGNIWNWGSPVNIATVGFADPSNGSGTLLLTSPLQADTPTPANANGNVAPGIGNGAWLCAVNSTKAAVTWSVPTTGTTTPTYTINQPYLYVGESFAVLIPPSATVPAAAIPDSVVTINTAGGVTGGPSAGATLGGYSNPPASLTSAGVLIRYPQTWKETTKLKLFTQVAVGSGTPTVTLSGGELANSQLAVGDNVVVDADGVWATTGDRAIAQVTGINNSSSQEQVTLKFPATPAIANLTSNTVLVKLGPSTFQMDLSGVTDTSGNKGPAAGGLYTTAFYCGSQITDNAATPYPICATGAWGVE